MNNFHRITLLVIVLLLVNFRLNAAEEDAEVTELELRLGLGIKSLVLVGNVGAYPMPISFSSNLDVKRWARIHADISFNVIVGIQRYGIGAGTAISVYGLGAALKGGLQIQIPIIIDLGYLKGSVSVGDGYDDKLVWGMLTPSTGIELTWWRANKLGFWVSLTGGFMFVLIDSGSDYWDEEYRHPEKNLGSPEITFVLGVAI